MTLKYICGVFESVKECVLSNGQIGLWNVDLMISNMYQNYIELRVDNELR